MTLRSKGHTVDDELKTVFHTVSILHTTKNAEKIMYYGP